MRFIHLIKFIMVGSIIFLNGCSPVHHLTSNKSYLCTLNSRGTTPSIKTFYFSYNEKQFENELEYKEYLNKLKVILGEVGYIESSQKDAELYIHLDYKIGNSYRYGNSSVSVLNIDSAISKTTEDYKLPLLVEIKAYDNKTKAPIWEVVVNDVLDRETQLQSVISFIFLCSKKYFGKNSNGEQAVVLEYTPELETKYGLNWPYGIKL